MSNSISFSIRGITAWFLLFVFACTLPGAPLASGALTKTDTVQTVQPQTETKLLPGLRVVSPDTTITPYSLTAGPVLDVPYNGSTFYKGTDLTFRWESVVGASKYEIWIDNQSGFGSPEVGYNNGQSSNWINNGIVDERWFVLTSAMQNQLPQNLYYWRVRALDSAGNPVSEWSVVRSFTLMDAATAPPAPVLNTPSNGSSGTDTTPDLSWTQNGGNVNYFHVQISTQNSFTTTVCNTENWSSFNYTPGNGVCQPLSANTYYWRVRAHDTNGTWSNWSSVWSFTITSGQTTQLNLIKPLAPTPVATKEITFEWSNIGAARYELYVDNNQGLGSPEISKANFPELNNYTQTSFSIQDYWLVENAYYWKVIAYMNDGTTVESALGEFTYVPPRAAAPVWVHLYRLYNSTEKDHYYTTVPAHRDQAVSQGYKYERIEGYVSDRPFDSLYWSALFHLYKPATKTHYYTASGSVKDTKIASEGYQYQGIVGFVYNNNSASDLVPLYQTEHVSGTDNFYTISQFERDNSINAYGFADRGTTGYVKYISPTNLDQPTVHARPQANFGGADLGSGAYRGLNSLDLVMAGAGPSLAFSHYYNSYNENLKPMGKGWSHGLNSWIVEEKRENINYVYVFWGDGAVSEYEKSGSTYKDNSGNHGVLTLVNDGVNYGYNLKTKDQTIYQFRKIGNDVSAKIVLIKIQDWKNKFLNFNYEASEARLMDVSDSYGRKLEFSHNNAGLLIGVKEVVGGAFKRSISFEYYDNGLLKSYTDPLNNKTLYEYYSQADHRLDLLKSITYPQGNNVQVDYDAAKKVTSMALSGQNPTTIAYNFDAATKITTTTVTDPKGAVMQAKHDSLMNYVGQRNGGGSQDIWATIERNDSNNPGLPTKVIDKEGNQTLFEYDSSGNLTKITNAKGKVALFTYNGVNNILTATDFHTPGAAPPATVFSYNATGLLLQQIKNPKNETINIAYNSANLVSSITDGLGNTATFEYDTYGNITKITDPENRITRTVNDYAGRVTELIDPNGIKTGYIYNANDLVQDISYYSKSLQKIFSVIMAYDKNGNLDNISWLNAVTALTQYLYDSYDRLISAKNPLNKQYSFTYDINNLVKTRTSPNQVTTTFQYDSYNRLQAVSYPDSGQNITVQARDKNGNITSIKGKNGTQAFAYDQLGQLSSHTDSFGKAVQYSYNDAGRLSSITYPGNKVVEYRYDAAGRLEYLQGGWIGTTRYIYDDASRIKEIQRPNGTKALFEYDKASNLISLKEQKSNGDLIAHYQYQVDPAGNYTSINAAVEPLSAQPSAKNVTYQSDAANKLILEGQITYTYDNNGNRTIKGEAYKSTTYSWDYENMLTKVEEPGKTVTYKYDAVGNRIEKSVNGTAVRYILDVNAPLTNVIAETDSNGNITAYYIHGMGLAQRVDTAGNSLYYHYNHRGDTIALTDQQQNVTDTYSYDEYGRLLGKTGQTANTFTYGGMYGVMDEGGDLYYMRARYYDAQNGVFLSEDPLGFGGGDWNIYAFAAGNPMMNIDPSGLSYSGFNSSCGLHVGSTNMGINTTSPACDISNFDPALTKTEAIIVIGLMGLIAAPPLIAYVAGTVGVGTTGATLGTGGLALASRAAPVIQRTATAIVKTKDLKPTHAVTMSNKQFAALKESILSDGVREALVYVEFAGGKYVVDGNNRLRALWQLGINSVKAVKTTLPYRGYRGSIDLFY